MAMEKEGGGGRVACRLRSAAAATNAVEEGGREGVKEKGGKSRLRFAPSERERENKKREGGSAGRTQKKKDAFEKSRAASEERRVSGAREKNVG